MAKFCTNCGKEIPESIAFCTECGTKVTEVTKQAPVNESSAKVEEVKVNEPVKATPPPTTDIPQPPPTYQAQPYYPYGQPQYQPPSTQPKELTNSDVAGTKYEPISTWGFIGIMLLMCIPVVGLILTIVWACGGCRKICKRSIARATIIMTVIGIVIGIILVLFGGALINSLLDKVGLETNGEGIFAGLMADDDGNKKNDEKEKSNGLMSLFGDTSTENSEGSDYSELGGLGEALSVLESLGALTGGESGDFSGLFSEIENINAEAEAQNNGWPKSLRKYPGGTSKEVASYRTIIENTSAEEMKDWINSLKSDGYVYTDFYEIGMSEADMLSANGWWGTNGEYYISVSYSDGEVIVDHLTELPESVAHIN